MGFIVSPASITAPATTALQREAYVDVMADKREAALVNPIRHGMMFHLAASCSTLSSPSPKPARQLPSWFGEYDTYQINLQSRLRVHDPRVESRSSEVWDGLMVPVTDPGLPEVDNAAVGITPIRVAVKFFQPSLFISAFNTVPIPNPDQEARLEAATYDILRELQGTFIPYFFGKQPVRGLVIVLHSITLAY